MGMLLLGKRRRLASSILGSLICLLKIILVTDASIIKENHSHEIRINKAGYNHFFSPDTTTRDTSRAQSQKKLLDNFRDAFKQMIESEHDSVNEKKQQQAERDLLLELDGMVIDNTRSRVGRNFYDLFYQYWEAPEDASNFTIRISERPTPTLGSLVSVKVNDEMIFQYKLQPRFEIIEKAAKYAVRITSEHLETTQQEYKIY